MSALPPKAPKAPKPNAAKKRPRPPAAGPDNVVDTLATGAVYPNSNGRAARSVATNSLRPGKDDDSGGADNPGAWAFLAGSS